PIDEVNVPVAMQRRRVCHRPRPWLISFSLDARQVEGRIMNNEMKAIFATGQQWLGSISFFARERNLRLLSCTFEQMTTSDGVVCACRGKLLIMQTSRCLLAILNLTILTVLSCQAARADEKRLMKAVVAHDYGAPDVLKFENVTRPEPKEDEALV